MISCFSGEKEKQIGKNRNQNTPKNTTQAKDRITILCQRILQHIHRLFTICNCIYFSSWRRLLSLNKIKIKYSRSENYYKEHPRYLPLSTLHLSQSEHTIAMKYRAVCHSFSRRYRAVFHSL
jgi:hypothetical protein